MDAHPWECPACHYRLQYPPLEDLEHVAWHEAGHALMRWLCAPDNLGTICIHPEGSGYSATATAGQRIRTEDALRIFMAGPPAEAGLLGGVDIARSVADDFEAMRQLLTPAYLLLWLGGRCTQDEAMDYYYRLAKKALWQHFGALEAIANALVDRYVLSAEELHAIVTLP